MCIRDRLYSERLHQPRCVHRETLGRFQHREKSFLQIFPVLRKGCEEYPGIPLGCYEKKEFQYNVCRLLKWLLQLKLLRKKAHNWGADLVKVFPAYQLGPDYFKSVSVPLAHIPLAAVGLSLIHI